MRVSRPALSDGRRPWTVTSHITIYDRLFEREPASASSLESFLRPGSLLQESGHNVAVRHHHEWLHTPSFDPATTNYFPKTSRVVI